MQSCHITAVCFRRLGRVLFIVSRCLEPLMRPEARVFVSTETKKNNFAVIHFL